MKSMIFVASMTAALLALPVSAQQGPAGVPGAPGLAETAKAAPPVAVQ